MALAYLEIRAIGSNQHQLTAVVIGEVDRADIGLQSSPNTAHHDPDRLVQTRCGIDFEDDLLQRRQREARVRHRQTLLEQAGQIAQHGAPKPAAPLPRELAITAARPRPRRQAALRSGGMERVAISKRIARPSGRWAPMVRSGVWAW